MTSMRRHTLVHSDGRRLYVYGELRGELPPAEPTQAPPALHLRRDPLTGGWVAVSPARNTRPQTGHADAEPDAEPDPVPDAEADPVPEADPDADADADPVPDADPDPDDVAHAGPAPARPACPLCPGGPEVPFSYEAAVFENRFPSFMAHPPAPPFPGWAGGVDVLQTAPSKGRCEVVLYTEEHDGSLATLSPEQVCRVVAVWRDRSIDLWSDPDHVVVLVFENRGEAVGATLSHPHGQIYAFTHLPRMFRERVDAGTRHREATGRCLGCDLVTADDEATERVVAKNDSFVVATPFAARWPYEIHVRARRHGVRRLGDLGTGEQLDLAQALRDVVLRYDGLFGFPLPYMMVAHESPGVPGPAGRGPDPDWHLSFEFFPPHRSPTKLKVRASVETATGIFINDTLPESSAAALAAVEVEHSRWPDRCVADIFTGGGLADRPCHPASPPTDRAADRAERADDHDQKRTTT
ncbi:MAG: galactose-1-phosphate uridylyltransferase [Euzebyaceae bacterium]|nr:galactose-1-phosphate uridylyltransferase [Euzebyaceae bacterium]